MKYVIIIAVLLLIAADLVTVDLIARYSCDRLCPKLPSFLSQGLVGKKAGKKKGFSKSRARAHGESEGRYMYYGKKEYDDLKRWILFVRENISADLPFYLYGMSAGAASAIMVCNDAKGLGIYGVIADSASTSARAAGKMTIKNIHLSPLIFYSQVRFDCYLRLKMDDNEFTPEMAIADSQTPILLIYGTKDRLAPPYMAQRLYDLCKAPKQMVEFKNAGHMKSYCTDPEKYQKALLDFFDRNENK